MSESSCCMRVCCCRLSLRGVIDVGGSFLYILIGAYTDICLGECIVIGEIGSDM